MSEDSGIYAIRVGLPWFGGFEWLHRGTDKTGTMRPIFTYSKAELFDAITLKKAVKDLKELGVVSPQVYSLIKEI